MDRRTESGERPTRSAMSRMVSRGSASTRCTRTPGAASSTCATTSMIAAASVGPGQVQCALPGRSACCGSVMMDTVTSPRVRSNSGSSSSS
ncbi:hypothetical protein [Actinomadura keratinilytica]|uniref:hypothetical protein n=1 Tax=Actinomadura keratinilytica TaxID=547461 RepID=UPI00360BDCB4